MATLELTLNGKTQIFPFKNGVSYLGFHTYVNRSGAVLRRIKNQNKRNAQKKYLRMAREVKEGHVPQDAFSRSYGAWRNHASHGSCRGLIKGMDERINKAMNESKLLEAAINDIPHTGKFCGHGYPNGQPVTIYCELNHQICVRQVNEKCGCWIWRGLCNG